MKVPPRKITFKRIGIGYFCFMPTRINIFLIVRYVPKPSLILSLFLLANSIKAQEIKESESLHGYNSIKAGIIGAFDGGSQISGAGLFYSYISFEPLSFAPSIGIYQINYTNADGYSRSAAAFEVGTSLNFQFLRRILNLRLNGYAGFHTKITDFATDPHFVGLSLGGGISFWRLSAETEAGLITYFRSEYVMGRINLSYIFCKNRSFWPPK